MNRREMTPAERRREKILDGVLVTIIGIGLAWYISSWWAS